MAHRERHRQKPPTRRPAAQLPETPSLDELERFSEAGLRQWRKGWEAHRGIYSELYFGAERQRAAHADELAKALMSNASQPLPLDGWARIVDWQYSLAPLSIAGSLVTEGGRFNIGRRLNPASFPPFGALYIADSHGTAHAEKFGIQRDGTREGLTSDEINLRGPNSYSYITITGHVELVFDAGNREALKDFAKIIAKFKMPERALTLARSIQAAPPTMIRSAEKLQTQILHPNWNTLPIHFSLPSNSQIFGRLLHAAGFHGVLYPSIRHNGGRCLALYPDNWRGSKSELHIVGQSPANVRLTDIDGNTVVFE
jgi:RES domain-containing protein